ncbi:lysylphosphatidylglycerol synthase transmembrane domain-containing protein [Kitasatospora purpeofusca]|uniref:lysylphosphatidylglycerol synthase transmembrane domain-containing protein n=1 Tax=Kitasatospora purpeofusca TaxID=67352 RepID=UPI00224E5F30|nr:lysylphosphatidylglycerol synthase transmembrane domain-containing protein [Kitasatospora purpeofusca]MCX4754392.1 flippase-like domain-containing protein [Kitasatospora purpeofusca]WSR33817.1 flippase-like domain-containing protein [Kitasatospora purpeofusca]WSR42033.1 flippase-like domain-containing protein [Kitasatospora purpeofusca]
MADATGNATSGRTGGTVEGTDDSTGGGTSDGTTGGPSGAVPAPPDPPAPPDRPGIAATGRLRQPAALIRLLGGLVVIALTLLSADYARATTNGLAEDVGGAAALVPHPLGGVATGLTTAAVLLLPGCSAARRLLAPGTDRRHVLQQLADGVLAAVLAYGATLLFALWIDGPAPFSLVSALTRPLPGLPLAHTEPVYGYLAPVLAFLTASAARDRRVPWTVLTLSALAGIASGAATPTALLLGVLIGWTAAHGTRWAVGTPDLRPRPGQLLHSLREAGLHPASVTPDGPDRYLVRQRGDRPDLDVQLLDRQAVTAALVQRVWRRLRLRTAPHPRALRSLRTGLEHEALLSYAAVAAGVRTRPVAATAELGRDAALVAYLRLPGRTLDELADEEVTDALLADVWGQLALLQRRAIAHRALVPSALLVDPAGTVHLVGLADGDIAAGELVLLSDIAQLLTTLALRTGAERSVRAAVSVLGPDAVAAALPLLQPIALTAGTRAALKQAARRDAAAAAPRVPPQRTGPETPADTAHTDPAPAAGPAPDLLDGIRAEVLRSRPQAPVRPVRLERLRPRTLLAVVGGLAAGWLLLPQLFATERNPIAAVADADPFWLALAVLAAAAGHVAGAMGFVGFVPERLDFRNAVLAQVAGSFVKLVSPGGVGGVALNTRFLQRAGIPTAQALSSVGAGQLLGLVLHLLQLGAFVYLTGVGPGSSELDALPAVVGGLALAGVLLASVSAVPPARRWLAARLRPLTAEVLPRLVELLRNPGRLAVGFTGQLLVSLTLVACLYCCARAVGQEPSFASVGVVFLVGNAAGNAAPTPGGAGFVDSALVGLLELAPSMEAGGAAAAVVLFRLLTFVLPVLPGWAAFTWLQRRKAL